MPDTPPDVRVTLPDAVAQRVIARAVELDVAGAARVPVARLREAVLEAGVSPAAFDAALAELRATIAADAERASAAIVAPAPHGRVAGAWVRVRDRMRGAAPVAPATTLDAVAVNGVALLTFWGATALLLRLAGIAEVGMGVDWPVRTLAAALGPAIGAAIAHRIGARVVRLPLLVAAVAIGAEFLMDLLFGGPVVRGAGAHWAVLLASAGGIGVGTLLGQARGRPRAPLPSAPPTTADATSAAGSVPTSDASRGLLRLRPAWLPRPTAP